MKSCLDCGSPARQARCVRCERLWHAKRNARPGRAIYGGTWPGESLAFRRAEPWCHALRHAATCDERDLTVDHPTRLVLSRQCHAALENERRRSRMGGAR